MPMHMPAVNAGNRRFRIESLLPWGHISRSFDLLPCSDSGWTLHPDRCSHRPYFTKFRFTGLFWIRMNIASGCDHKSRPVIASTSCIWTLQLSEDSLTFLGSRHLIFTWFFSFFLLFEVTSVFTLWHWHYHGICLSRRRQPTAIPCSHHRFAKRSPDSAFTWLKPKPVIRPQMKPWCIPKKRNFQSLPNQSKERKMLTFSV